MLTTLKLRLNNSLKKLAAGANEWYVLSLITIGLPAIFYMYFDWRAAVTVFVLSQIPLGVLRERLK